MPEEWLKKYGLLAGLGNAEGDHLRFTRSQAGLLDALLAAEPAVPFDACSRACARSCADFAGVASGRPAGGVSRRAARLSARRAGLAAIFSSASASAAAWPTTWAWARPIQVLALLEARRELRRNDAANAAAVAGRGAALAGFQLERGSRALHAASCACSTTPASRAASLAIIRRTTTWCSPPTARCAATPCSSRTSRFDYVHSRRSPGDQERRHASRPRRCACCSAEHRLALTGTPVENHLGELWSLFEFLNPGMLGARVGVQAPAPARNPDDEHAQLLAQALRPFILRRTKEQVATRAAGENRADDLLRARSRAAQALRRAARPLPRLAAARRSQSDGIGQVEDASPRSAAAPAPGGLPSRA